MENVFNECGVMVMCNGLLVVGQVFVLCDICYVDVVKILKNCFVLLLILLIGVVIVVVGGIVVLSVVFVVGVMFVVVGYFVWIMQDIMYWLMVEMFDGKCEVLLSVDVEFVECVVQVVCDVQFVIVVG